MKQLNEKIMNFWQKYAHFLTFLVGLSICAFMTLKTTTQSGDEIWTFGNIYKMILGGKIYVDNNVIQTPIFFVIGKILLQITGANLMWYRIYNLLIWVFLLEIVYQLFEALEFSKKATTYATIGITSFGSVLITSGANYNILVFAFVLLGILLQLKYHETKIEPILQGCACFIVFMTKQNVGVFYIIATIGYHLCSGLYQKNLKQQMIIITKELSIAGILLLGTLTLMHFNGNLEGFINYAVLGIKEFSQSNGSSSIYEVIAEILLGLFMLCLMVILTKGVDVNKKQENNIILLITYTVPHLLITYPLANYYHMTLANLLPAITLIYGFSVLLKQVKMKGRVMEIVISFIMIALFIMGPIQVIHYAKTCDKTPGVYYGAVFSAEQKRNLDAVCQYIQKKTEEGTSVKMLSHKAIFYMTPLQLNNGEMDLPLRGNLGKEGEDGLIRKIASLKNTEILITKDEEDQNYQESPKVREYIQTHFTNIGEIEEFYIYQTQ